MSRSVSIFIVVFTLLNVVACLWLIWWNARRHADEPVTTGHKWDGDLEEYNNPLPRWWLWLFIITIIFGVGYLIIYPGLGTYAGTKQWTTVGQYEAEKARAREMIDVRLAPLATLSVAELVAHEGAMSTAKNLFAVNCSTCHGSDARGARGFPNLADTSWQWGGDAEAVYRSIAYGRDGIMPALGGALGREGVEEVAAYVLSLNGRKAPADWVEAGSKRFATLCAGCHGIDGKGMTAMGAPDLTDNVWLHGSDLPAIRQTIANGRHGQMPAHLELLGEMRTRLLTAYVLSLAQPTDRSSSATEGAAAANEVGVNVVAADAEGADERGT